MMPPEYFYLPPALEAILLRPSGGIDASGLGASAAIPD
jgi:hypothetical protein